MADLADIDKIEDEDVLESMINKTEDLNIRRQIRKRQKDIREKRHAAYEASKSSNAAEDAVTMKLRLAEAEKQRKMKGFEEAAKDGRTMGEMGAGESAIQERQRRAEEEKQRKLGQYKEMGKVMSSTYNTGVTDVLKERDGTNGEDAQPAAKTTSVRGGALGGGTSYVAKPGPQNAAAAPAAGGSKVARNPSAIKEMLLEWCKKQVEGYEHVNITNFSSSWSDGMAFCALIHHFCPHTFDYAKLNPKNRRGNFTLAFKVAEKEADIAPLLDVEDMVRMKNPDWKCVFTYVQGFYRRFGMPQKQPGSPTSPTSP